MEELLLQGSFFHAKGVDWWKNCFCKDHSFTRWGSRHLRGRNEALGGTRLGSRHLRGEMKCLEGRGKALGGARLVSRHLRGEMKRLEGRGKAPGGAGQSA